MEDIDILKAFINESGNASRAAIRLKMNSGALYSMMSGKMPVGLKVLEKIKSGNFLPVDDRPARTYSFMKPVFNFDISSDLTTLSDVDIDQFINAAQMRITSAEDTIKNAMAEAQRKVDNARSLIPDLKAAGKRAVQEQSKRKMRNFGGNGSHGSPTVITDEIRAKVLASSLPSAQIAKEIGIAKSTAQRIRKKDRESKVAAVVQPVRRFGW
jgi:hypothetical protein